MRRKGILIFSAVIIAMFCVLGMFSRPYPADEYGFYNRTKEFGVIQAVIHEYSYENGRLTNHFLMNAATIFPLEKFQPFLALIISITYIMAAFLLIEILIPSLKFRDKLTLSFLMCALSLCFTYSLRETFYWLPGSPYFWSGTLLLLALGLAVKAFRGSRASFILCMAVIFLIGVNLEQPCIFEGIIAFLAMLYFAHRGEKSRAFMSWAFWLVSIIAFCVMYFAPGTAMRMSGFTTADNSTMRKIILGLRPALSLGILNTFSFFAKPLIYIVIFFMPAIAEKIPSADERISRRLRFWHITAIVLAICVFMEFMIGVVSSGWSMPERGVSLDLWIMYLAWNIMFVFFYRGKWIYSERFKAFCLRWRYIFLVASVIVSANFIDCIRDLRIAPEYNAEWDSRHNMMIEQAANGKKYLIVPLLKTRPRIMTEWDIGIFKESEQIAKYYGAETVLAVLGELLSDDEAVKEILTGNFAPLEKLAEAGNPDAAFFLARLKDFRGNAEKEAIYSGDAIKYYTIASEAGNVEAMKSLSRLLLPIDFARAVYWLGKYTLHMTRL